MKLTGTFKKLTVAAVFLFVTEVTALAVPEEEFQNLTRRSNVAFNVSPPGVGCEDGTTITCFNLSPGDSCKGNFSPAQNTVVVTEALFNCHISLYPDSNQGGGVAFRINTDTTGECATTSPPYWKSYGIYC